jgi:hypothetical protein
VVLVSLQSGCDSKRVAAKNNVKSKTSSTNAAIIPFRGRLTRLFWQDREEGLVYAGDLQLEDDAYKLVKSKVQGFPDLSPQDNNLVQMAIAGNRLIVGVRDNDNGNSKSGWIEIDTGVEEEDHGDHSHWHYPTEPKVSSVTLDDTQGNPAHVYRYGKYVYIANDKNNGFTQVDPANGSARFYEGGGGHITMAAVNNRIAYSTWIDRAGDNMGRVDVVSLRGDSTSPKYSFRLPVGGIHGAGTCGNRVYFAPANGVCWVDCDFDFAESAESVSVQQLSLDETDDGKEYRTGAFESFRDHILCIAKSKSGAPALCVINATAPDPQVTRIVCDELGDGLKMSTVKANVVSGNHSFAYAFAEGSGSDEEQLLVFELDPDGDRRFNDAKLAGQITVGRSNLEGHFGHHGITFLDDRKTAVVSNPGDGTLSLVDLVDLKIIQTIEVGGQPTHLFCHGGKM